MCGVVAISGQSAATLMAIVVTCLGLGASGSGWAFLGSENELKAFAIFALMSRDVQKARARRQADDALTLSSEAFSQDGLIPLRHGCDGGNVSPPLSWAGLPAGTRSLVLIVDSPDAEDSAARRTAKTHWIMYNIAPTINRLPESAGRKRNGTEAFFGLNDWRSASYRGPCPDAGVLRLAHQLYALDTMLPDLQRPTRTELENAMQGHVLARSRLVGLYQRRK